MNNEDEAIKTLIKKKKKQKNPNKEQQPQQINKVVIDYDQVVIALPHFPKPPKIRIKPLGDRTHSTTIKGLLDESKSKRKKAKKVNVDERNGTQMGTSVVSNGVDGFEPKLGLVDGKDESSEGVRKKKKVSLGERDGTQMGKGVCSNGVDDLEMKLCLSDGKDERLEGKKKKKKKKKREDLDVINESKMGKGVCSNGVDDVEGLNKVVKRRRVSDKEESVECRFPVNRIVRIIKSQGDDYKLGHEAVFLINKATEKFIELFSEDAYDCALEEKKNFVSYKHLSSAVGKEKRLDFLSDFVPEKITAEKALAGWKSAETLPS